MNRIFYICLSAAVSLFPAFAFSASQHAPSVNSVIQQTLDNHPDLLRLKNERVAATKDIRQARGFFLPTLNVTTGLGKERSDNVGTRAGTGGHNRTLTRREAEYRIRQLLFDGGDTASRVMQRKFDYSTVNFQVSETAERLGFLAVDAYLGVLRRRELVRVAQSDVHAHKDALDKVEKRLQAGAGRKSEVSLVKSRLALSQGRLEQAEGDLDDANATYKVIVGVSYVPTGLYVPRLPQQYIPRSLPEAQEIAMQANPSIAVLQSQYEASIASVELAKSTYFPVVTLEMGGTYDHNIDGTKGHNNDAEAMIRMRYNLYRGGSDKAAIGAAKSRKVAALYEIDNIRRDVNEDVALAWNELQTTRDRLPYLRKHRDESLDVFKAYQKQFLLGQRTLFDLLNAETEYYDAKRSLVEGEFDYYRAHFRILVGMGTLLKNLVSREDKDDYYAFAEREPSGEWVVRPPEDEEHLRKKVVVVDVNTSHGDASKGGNARHRRIKISAESEPHSLVLPADDQKTATPAPAPASDKTEATPSSDDTEGVPDEFMNLQETKKKQTGNKTMAKTKQPNASDKARVVKQSSTTKAQVAKQASPKVAQKAQHAATAQQVTNTTLPIVPQPVFSQTQAKKSTEEKGLIVKSAHLDVSHYHLPQPLLERARS